MTLTAFASIYAMIGVPILFLILFGIRAMSEDITREKRIHVE